MASKKTTPTTKRRNLRDEIAAARTGVEFELEGGGFVTLVAQYGNNNAIRRHGELLDAARERRGLAVDAELPMADLIEASQLSQAGTVLLEFREFEVDEGEELRAFDDDGKPIDASFALLLTLPSTRDQIARKVKDLDARVRRNREVAEKNSQASSVGTSATDPTSTTS